MNSKLTLFFLLILYLFTTLTNSYCAESDSTLKIIIFPYLKILYQFLDQNNEIDVRMINYKEKIPRIIYKYLYQSKTYVLIDRSRELSKLKKFVNDENNEGLIKKSLTLISEEPDAFLFTTIDKYTETVTLGAKILDLKSNLIANSSQKIKFSDFLSDDSLSARIKELSDSLIIQNFPSKFKKSEKNIPDTFNMKSEPENNKKSSIIKSPLFWSSISTTASTIWLVVEEKNIDKNYKNYQLGTSIQEVTKSRINTEKAITRRNFAAISTAISSSILFSYIIKKYLFHRKNDKIIKAKGKQYNNDRFNFNLQIHPITNNGLIAARLGIHF